MVREDRGRAGRRLRALLRGLSAHRPRLLAARRPGGVEPAPPLAGDVDADVVVIGGGYTGLWTAWQLRARGASVVLLEAERLRPRAERAQRRLLRDAVDAPAVAGRALRPRAGAGGLRGVDGERARDRRVVRGSRASTPGSRAPGYLMASTAPAHDAVIDEILAAAPRDTRDRARRGRACARAATRRASAAGCSCPTTRPSSRRGSRSACARGCSSGRGGLRALARARAATRRPAASSPRPAAAASARAPRCSRVNAATRGFRPLRARLSVTSSHIVLTEPVPDVLEAARLDRRRVRSPTRARSCTTSAPRRDGRIAFGWGGGRLAPGARLGGRVEVDADVAAETRRHLVDDVPGAARAARSRTPGAARSTSRRAICRRSARSTARRCTTRSASPATASARRTWPAACSPRWRRASATDLALVDPEPARVPPEPFAWLGGMLVPRRLGLSDVERLARALAACAAPDRALAPRLALRRTNRAPGRGSAAGSGLTPQRPAAERVAVAADPPQGQLSHSRVTSATCSAALHRSSGDPECRSAGLAARRVPRDRRRLRARCNFAYSGGGKTASAPPPRRASIGQRRRITAPAASPPTSAKRLDPGGPRLRRLRPRTA